MIQFQAYGATEQELQTLTDNNIEFAVATINDPKEAQRLLKAGATSIITDDVALLDK